MGHNGHRKTQTEIRQDVTVKSNSASHPDGMRVLARMIARRILREQSQGNGNEDISDS